MADITFQDIKKAYHTQASSSNVTLCYSGKTVKVRQIKMKDKKEFLKYLEKDDDELIDSCIDSLIERYVTSEDGDPIDARKLVDKERHQLLMKIRTLSSNQEEAEIDHICPKCEEISTIKFPLNTIEVINYKKPDGYDDVITSKNGGVRFKIGNLTRENVVDIEKYIKDKNLDTDVEKEFVYLAGTIKEIYVNIDDVSSSKFVPSVIECVEFLENVSFDDFDKVKNYFANTKDYGLNLKINFTCKCGYKNEKEEVKIADFFTK